MGDACVVNRIVHSLTQHAGKGVSDLWLPADAVVVFYWILKWSLLPVSLTRCVPTLSPLPTGAQYQLLAPPNLHRHPLGQLLNRGTAAKWI